MGIGKKGKYISSTMGIWKKGNKWRQRGGENCKVEKEKVRTGEREIGKG
jgi:hypothetical protein